MAVFLSYLSLHCAIQRILTLKIMTVQLLLLLKTARTQPGYVLKNREILCHSCASSDYTKVWLGVLDEYLYRPKTFSIICQSPGRTTHLGMYRACNGSCVSMEERKVVGGFTQEKLYIRGCMLSMFKKAATYRAILDRQAYHMSPCVTVPVNELYHSMLHDNITVCTCDWDECNTYPHKPRVMANSATTTTLRWNISRNGNSMVVPIFVMMILSWVFSAQDSFEA